MDKQDKQQKRRFAITREYKYIKRYKVIQKSFLDKLLEDLKPKKEKKKEIVKEVKEEKAVKGADIALMKALPIIIFVVIIGYVFFTFQNIQQALQAQLIEEKKEIIFPEIRRAFFSDYGSISERKSAVILNVYLPEEKMYTVRLSHLTRPFSNIIYIYSDDIYPKTQDTVDFINMLKKRLERRGFIVQNINSKEQILYMASNSIFVLPSDKIPPNMEEYFEFMIKKDILPIIISSTPTEQQFGLGIKDINPYWASKNIQFVPTTQDPKNMRMYQMFYLVKNAQLINDGASYFINEKTGDEFIFVPGSVGDSLINHWKNVSDAVLDVEDLIIAFVNGLRPYERQGKEYVPVETVYNLENGSHYIFIESDNIDKKSFDVLVTFEFDEEKYFKVVSVHKDYNGYIFPAEKMPILPFYVRKSHVLLQYLPNPEKQSFSKLSFYVYDNRGSVIEEIPISGHAAVSLNSISTIQYINTSLQQGRYLLEIKDKQTDVVYARTLLELGSLDIRTEADFDKGKITFYFEIAGRPTKVGYVTLSLKGADFQAGGRNTDRLPIDMSQYFGGSIPAGNYTFLINIEGLGEREINVYNPPRIGLSRLFSPERIVMFLLAGGIYAVGMLVKQREELPYTIDIPDFAPVEYTTLELTKEEIKEAFNKIQEYYRWRYTPLTLQEIKNGIAVVLGRQDLVINDFNLEIVLSLLEKEGIIKEESGYYMLTDWLKTGFSPQQLVAFRIIRDIALENAIPFKPLTRSLPHTKLTFPWQEFWIYIYSSLDKESIIDSVLTNVANHPEHLHIILVHNEEEAYTFRTLLSSGRKKDSLLKSYLNTETVLLFTTDELLNKIKELI
jgi:hypothetical protein